MSHARESSMGLSGWAKLLRVFVGEADRIDGRPLYERIVETARTEGLAGATVTRGLAGFGAHSRIHTASLEVLSIDLPLVVEVVDLPDKIDNALARVGPMVREGLITLEDVQIVKYTHRELQPLPADRPVREMMTKEVVTVRPDTPIADVMDLLIGKLYKAVPVVDAEQHVVGLITDGDLLRQGGLQQRLSVTERLDQATLAAQLDEMRRAGKMARDEQSKAPAAFITRGPNGAAARAVPAVTYGRIIVVYSPKGGSGCTTVATNLAMSLQNEETSVALVDGNLQYGDVAVFLNEQSKNSVVDLALRADELDPEIVEEVLITHTKSGVRVLAAPSRPEYAEDVTGEQFSKVLRYLRKLYSYIVVDTSSTMTDVTLAAIDTSDVIVLLTTQEIPAIKNARLFLDLVDVLDIDRSRVLFVMNRYDKRIGITPEKIGDNFKQEIVAVLPAEDRVVIPSINRGVPFMLGDKSRPIARSFLSMTEVVRDRLTKLEPIDEAV